VLLTAQVVLVIIVIVVDTGGAGRHHWGCHRWTTLGGSAVSIATANALGSSSLGDAGVGHCHRRIVVVVWSSMVMMV